MAKEEKTSVSAIAEETMKQARGSMESYLDFYQKAISASPWAGTELIAKLVDYTQQNINTAFGFVQKLTQAKDLQDLVRIQTEFFQTQMKSLTEQTRDLSEIGMKTTAGAFKGALP